MRLWHKDLISVLPRQQLLGQWRECCCIARNMNVNGTPNHILVNKILDYDIGDFCTYALEVFTEMQNRGYWCDFNNFTKWFGDSIFYWSNTSGIFSGWHDQRYLDQCYYNLQEKYDCGGVSHTEWQKLEDMYFELKGE